MAKRDRKMDFEGMIKDGEKRGVAGGFVAQTANGTAMWKGEGWNENGPSSWPQLPPGPTRPAGRSNRTGE